MSAVAFNKPALRLIVDFTPAEAPILQWVQDNYGGLAAFQKLIDDFMTSRSTQMDGTRVEQLAVAYKVAPQATKDQVKALLGVTF